MKNKFNPGTTASLLDLSKIDKKSPVFKLIKKLNINRVMGSTYEKGSIMQYGRYCTCDSGYLCEHRLQYIVDFVSSLTQQELSSQNIPEPPKPPKDRVIIEPGFFNFS